MRVACQLNLEQVQSDRQSGEMDKVDSVKPQADGEYETKIECGKVLFGSPYRIRTFFFAFLTPQVIPESYNSQKLLSCL